jgi:hypothetical protein
MAFKGRLFSVDIERANVHARSNDTFEQAWKEIRDRLQAPCYMSRGDHSRKIRASKVKTDVWKFSFVNRTIADWNRLPERTIGISPLKTHIFRRRVREVKQ